MQKNFSTVGLFETTFGQRCDYIYMSISASDGYFVRKEIWGDILDNSPDISSRFKVSVLF